MLRWPWVSRLAYDDARKDVERLLGVVERLADQVTRIQRFSQGMTEAPRAEREPLGKVPAMLVQYIAGAQSAQIRREMERTFWQRRAAGESADAIVADMIPRTDNGGEPEPNET